MPAAAEAGRPSRYHECVNMSGRQRLTRAAASGATGTDARITGALVNGRRCFSRRAAVALLALSAGLLASGCERPLPGRSATESKLVSPPEKKPAYVFAPGLRETYPQVTGFMQEFLETCLAGDYDKYRLMVSRSREPESRERFGKIYHALKSLAIDAIEVIHVPDLPPPVHLVVCRADFLEGRKPLLRRETNQVAILVFQEENEWRMMPAPGELQPRDDRARRTDDEDEPEPQLPDYPWERYGA